MNYIVKKKKKTDDNVKNQENEQTAIKNDDWSDWYWQQRDILDYILKTKKKTCNHGTKNDDKVKNQEKEQTAIKKDDWSDLKNKNHEEQTAIKHEKDDTTPMAMVPPEKKDDKQNDNKIPMAVPPPLHMKLKNFQLAAAQSKAKPTKPKPSTIFK